MMLDPEYGPVCGDQYISDNRVNSQTPLQLSDGRLILYVPDASG
ncbi:unnamed protein product, partial [marine sediment metagenome]